MADLTLKCQDCGNEFVWTEGEQKFYKEKGLPKPKYCLICRAKYQARERQFGPYKERVRKNHKTS